MKRVRIVAIEGLDGVGKETIAEKLVEVCRQRGLKAEKVSFPRYDTKWGEAISGYLHGDLGDASEVSPFLAASLYTADRHAYFAENPIKKMDLDVLVLDRSYFSNFIHQGSKFNSAEGLFIWMVVNYASEITGIPGFKESFQRVCYLKLDEESRRIQMENRSSKDQHESNLEYMHHCESFIEMTHTGFFMGSIVGAAKAYDFDREYVTSILDHYCGRKISECTVKHVPTDKLDEYSTNVARSIFSIAGLDELVPPVPLNSEKAVDMRAALDNLGEGGEFDG